MYTISRKHNRDRSPYETPKRNPVTDKVANEVKEQLAGHETFLTDAERLRLAYENPVIEMVVSYTLLVRNHYKTCGTI